MPMARCSAGWPCKLPIFYAAKTSPSIRPTSTPVILSLSSTPKKSGVTGKKETDKEFMSYSGWKGGEKYRTVAQVRAKHPEKLILHAVKGMIPKNRLGSQLLTKLKVFKGPKHPHAAQKPEPLKAAA